MLSLSLQKQHLQSNNAMSSPVPIDRRLKLEHTSSSGSYDSNDDENFS